MKLLRPLQVLICIPVLAWGGAVALFLGSSVARAEEPMLPAAMGVAGASRASATDNSVLELNPASLALNPRYTAAVGFEYYGRLNSKRLTTTAMDSRTGNFGLGVAYTVQWLEPPFDEAVDLAWYDPEEESPEDKRTYHRIVVAGAYGLLSRHINLGVSLKILRYDEELRDNQTHVTLDVGGSFKVSDNVVLFVVGNNLVPTDRGSDPLTLASGMGVTLGPIRMEAGALVDFSEGKEAVKVDLNAGAEFRFLPQVAITGGYGSDRGFRDSYVTWGVGWETTRFSARYAMRIEAGNIDKRRRDGVNEGWDRILHSFGVEVAF